MNLEEVKEYFKDAEKVRCLVDSKVYNIDFSKGIRYYDESGYWISTSNSTMGVKLWSKNQGFAEIITYEKDAQRIKEDCELLDKFSEVWLKSDDCLDIIKNLEQFGTY